MDLTARRHRGRPRLYPRDAQRVTISLPATLHAALCDLAAANGYSSATAVITALLEDHARSAGA